MRPVARLRRQEEDGRVAVFVVVGFLGPVPTAAFARRDWPWHITVSTNFDVDVDGPDLVEALAATVAGRGRVSARAGARAAFGDEGSIPVVLVEPPEPWRELHDRVAVVVTSAGGRFTTGHTGDAYRAHVTHTRAGAWSEAATVSRLHLVRLDGDTAAVEVALPLDESCSN
jgi:2'-5' RNA ligase